MVRMTFWMGMLWLACTSAGCGHFVDCIDSTCYRWKCEHRAKAAWMEVRDLYHGVAHRYNFGEGFRDGYMNVCMGDDTGCAPAVPPRRYWSSSYLNCEGKAKTMAWFDGYAHGVLAASCSGVAGQCQIATIAGGGGSGDLGTALKGYKPPMTDPYGRPLPPEPHPVPDYGYYDSAPYVPEMYEGQPTPSASPIVPPPAPQPMQGIVPQFDGEFAPEAPAEPSLPDAAHALPEAAPLPAAEALRVPVF
jgi:hypothetical protein